MADPKPNYHYIESTLDVEVDANNVVIRLWIDEKTIPIVDHTALEMITKWSTLVREAWTSNGKDALQEIASWPNVNAVQMIYTLAGGVRWGRMIYTLPF